MFLKPVGNPDADGINAYSQCNHASYLWNFVIPRLVLLAAIWICYRVRINFSMLYRGRLYDKNLLALASSESPSV